MQLKTLKNSKLCHLAWCLVLALMVLAPLPSYAYDFENRYGVYDVTNQNNTVNSETFSVCSIDSRVVPPPGSSVQYTAENRIQFGLVKRIVLCVKESVLYATYQMLAPISQIFASLVAIMMTFAVMIWGMQAVAGRRMAATRETFVLAIKIGIVIMFSASFAAEYFDPEGDDGGLFGLILSSMEEMVAIVLSYTDFSRSFSLACAATQTTPQANDPLFVLTVWDKLDCMIETLIGGVFSPLSLSAGIIGFLVAALLSNVIGFFIATLGFVVILQLLMVIIWAVYVFISAFIGLGLMILIFPMVIPTILFAYTKPYFDKWLKITMGLILQPIFMFVYLAMLMAAVDVLIFDGPQSVFRTITGTAYDARVSPLAQNRVPIGQWFNGDNSLPAERRFAVYEEKTKAEYGINVDYRGVPNDCTQDACEAQFSLNKRDTGLLGVVGEETRSGINRYQSNLYDILGNRSIFKGGIPLRVVDWDHLFLASNAHLPDAQWDDLRFAYQAYDACRTNPLRPPFSMMNGVTVECTLSSDPMLYYDRRFLPYMINILASMAMAVLTLFMFMILQRALPYIGIGISGETLSIPGLGVGKLAAPGTGFFNRVQSRITSTWAGRPAP